MKISFVAGFGPIVRDTDASRAFWGAGLGIGLEEAAPGYWTNDDLEGVKAFALWPLSQAAESTFGTDAWPEDVPVPQAWMELDVESADAVAEAVAQLQAGGHRLLRGVHEEPWGPDHVAPPEPRGPARGGDVHALDARQGVVADPAMRHFPRRGRAVPSVSSNPALI
jgi:catechol 2,3-dioxygenase-like lactoylglutathione lyase family enzyme